MTSKVSLHQYWPSVTWLAFTVLVLGCGSPGPSLPQPGAPIIIIDIDTLRADHLGCYGYQRPTSPNIDGFAAESVLFEWAFSQAPNTPPSQTSILTGLYPGTHGMIEDEDIVPDGITTLAEALAAHGMMTTGFHDGGYMSDHFNIGQGFQIYDNNRGQGLKGIGPKVFDWLRENHDQPFLLFVHTYDTHTPYDPTPPFDALFVDEVPPPSPGFSPTTEQMEKIRLSKYTEERLMLADNDLGYAMARYDAEIAYVDDWFGEFMALIRELGLDDRATIVFISDHGEEFQEHGSVLHEKLYATVTRVPLIVRLPGGGISRRVPQTVQAMDIMPTLLDLAGCPIPDEVQANSLTSLIFGVDGEHPLTAFGESPFFGERRFIATGRHHLLFTKKNKTSELYDFRIDPLEQIDISSEQTAETARLQDLIEDWDENIRLPFQHDSQDGEDIDEATLEQLKELGYIQE